MAIITEHLELNKQFLIIDSPIPFKLIANNGTDEVYRMAGAWQIDTHKLLPEKYQKQYPVFNLDLVYDDTNLNGGVVTVRESNIDIGDGISGVNGQDVKVTNFDEISPLQIKNELDNNNNPIPLIVEKKNEIIKYISTTEIEHDLTNELFFTLSKLFNNNYFLNVKRLISLQIKRDNDNWARYFVFNRGDMKISGTSYNNVKVNQIFFNLAFHRINIYALDNNNNEIQMYAGPSDEVELIFDNY